MFQKLALRLQQRTIKKHLLILVLGALVGILLYYYIVTSEEFIEQIQLKDAVLAGLCGVLISYCLAFLTKLLDRVFSWKTQTAGRMAAGIIGSFLTAYIIFYSAFYAYQRYVIEIEEFSETFDSVLIKIAILVFILTLIFSVVYFALYSYYAYATLQIETVRQERKHIDLRLKALKSQLSPHFLFNSLNTISSLVYNDPAKADIFIRQLAKIYKYTLDSYHIKLTSLKEELKLVSAYQYLLHTRFADKLKCEIDIPESLMDTKIPPLTLQLLLENAVKHNQLDDEQPLSIHIGVEDDYLFIRNNVTKSPAKKTSFHIGLKNINSRYLLLINKGIISSNGQNFIVKLPIIR